ncbi:hypothetical protein [Pseudoxanthomonas sp. Root630]|uniref:hypothetical protein n=1 Tax=Pseudoxanthomonas sp. Root630 TaxID=1736574 RepID=UPI0012DE7095|nr:hypothetical protein [Pseudoxanthomonas sp. Root630]
MSRRPLLFASIALVLAAVGGLGWWGGRASHDAASSDISSTDDADATTTAARAAASARAPAQRPPDRPLPPLDQPLRDILPELKRRADAGEAAASCRLAAELDFCAQIRMRLASTAEMLRDGSESSVRFGQIDPNATRQEQQRQSEQALVAHSERLLEESAHCESVPASTPAQRVQYWRSAALGGNPMALRMYASGNAFRQENLLDQLEALRLYRGEAESMALRAAQSGDRMMVMALGHAYSPNNREQRRSLLSQAVKPDGARALAFYLHAQAQLPAPPATSPRNANRQAMRDNRLTRSIRELETQLDPAALAQARQLAADMARDYAPPAMSSSGTTSRTEMRGIPGGILRAQCSDD